jgi:hypothetical protein
LQVSESVEKQVWICSFCENLIQSRHSRIGI